MLFSFGGSEHERLEVDVIGYERKRSGDSYDDNWLIVEARARIGGFRGKVGATFLTTELAQLASELQPLFESLAGTVEFRTLEEQLHLRLTGNGKGHIKIAGELQDKAGIGNTLHFELQIDQTELAASIRELRGVVTQFPVRESE